MTARRDLTERSRLLGADRSLVVHGGGNTSAKGEITDHLGRVRRVMWVKGSGSDLATADEGDFPALYLDELTALEQFDELTDELMTDYVARALVVPGARRPSIETLLHAFLPYRHIDHVHADAICALTNHPEGRAAVRDALGDRFAYLDWIRPGFTLSKLVGELADHDGVVLAHHGLVTWADTSDTCHKRTLDAVGRAADYLAGQTHPKDRPPATPDLSDDEIADLLLRLRGRLSRAGHGGAGHDGNGHGGNGHGGGARHVLAVDTRLRSIADRADAGDVVAAGVSSADHMFWIKPWACFVDPADPEAAIDAYEHRYQEYFDRHRDRLPDGHGMHDPAPRALLVPGLGSVTTGLDLKDAQKRADVVLHSHTVAAEAIDAFGASESLRTEEVFDFDYWPMELYKLRLRPAPARFAGRIFVVTGAASGIGRATAAHLAGLGASLVLGDIDADGLRLIGEEITKAGGPEPALVVGDQAEEAVVVESVRCAVRTFGGLDGSVINAGVGVTGRLEELSLDAWRQALDINLTSAFLLTRESMKVLRRQGTGGALVYMASKNAFGPGAGFGAYSASKAAMVQLMRIAAMEGGAAGIRSNAVNPDAIFGGSRLWSPALRAERAAAHGIPEHELEDFYAARNLLHRHVTTHDVAESVAFLLSDDPSSTTGCVLSVDGGVAAAFPR